MIMNGLVEYKDLSPSAKGSALMNVLESFKDSVGNYISLRKAQSLHQKINDKHSLKKIFNQTKLVKKLQDDSGYLEKVVISNLCHFNKQGHYYQYMKKEFISNF